MAGRAPRPRLRGLARGAGLAAGLWLAGALASAAQDIAAAAYDAPTTRYAHGVLGDAIEHGALVLTLTDGRRSRIVLPETRVFEDTAPRLADLDGDGGPEVIVVESDLSRGARLAVYDADGLVAATPFIGQRNRWLAPLGAADLDGDGAMEIAYVDRPHLARVLRVWRFAEGTLRAVAAAPGHTNHRIGERHISGGLRDCGAGPEIVTATPAWTGLLATRLRKGVLESRPIAPAAGAAEFAAALACR